MKKLLRRLIAVLCVLALSVTSASALSVEEAVALLEEHYVDELPAAAYDAQTLDELFAALGDPYTYYMSAPDYEAFTSGVESESSVTGIGATIQYAANGIELLTVLPGGGAEEAGLKRGDLIVAVEGVSCAPAGEQHRAMIVGEEGTAVTLTVRHTDGTVQDYRIVRKTVAIHNTTVTLRDGAGWIDCDSFGTQTDAYFREGVGKYDADADVWVVDLRGNTGGVANAAVNAIGVFSGSGIHLYFRDRAGRYSPLYYFGGYLTETPVIVLVDDYSASASEVFAGGIRATGAGIVVGGRTYGKGVAQIVLDEESHPGLFDGDSLKVTAYRFYSADGNTTDKIGVLPTLYVGGYAEQAAELLRTEKPGDGDWLGIKLMGWTFYIDLDKARSEAYADAFEALLKALPPDVPVVCPDGGEELALTPEEAAARLAVDVPANRFADVAGSRFAAEIDTLAAYGILRGSGNGAFRPNSKLHRAELCAMLAQALNVTSDAESAFTDVPDRAWYSGSVNAIALMGLVEGDGDRFDPAGVLTQDEFIAVMGRLSEFLNMNARAYMQSLTDEELAADGTLSRFSPEARRGAAMLSRATKAPDGSPFNIYWEEPENVDPLAPVTRGQAAATLCTLLKAVGLLAY